MAISVIACFSLLPCIAHCNHRETHGQGAGKQLASLCFKRMTIRQYNKVKSDIGHHDTSHNTHMHVDRMTYSRTPLRRFSTDALAG